MKMLLRIGSLLFLLCPKAWAAIAVDSAAVNGEVNNPVNAIAFTVGTGADRVLVVGTASTGQAQYFPVSTVTFAGASLTLEARAQYTNTVYQDVELWYEVAPPAGLAGTLTVTYPSTVESVVGVMDFSGVDPAVTFGALTAGAASSDALSTEITTLYPSSWLLLGAANYSIHSDKYVEDPNFTLAWGAQSGGTEGLFEFLPTTAPGVYAASTSYTDSVADTVMQQLAELVPLQPTATPTLTPTLTLTAQPTPVAGREFAWPNPFFPDRPPLDHITFALSAGHAAVRLSILDLNLRVRWEGEFPPGSIVSWDGRDQRGASLNSGAYLYLLDEAGRAAIKGSLVLAR
ncbi:MAG: hypothetical protein ACREKE_10960 [bacterium]